MTPSTFPALLADQVQRSPGRPLVTFYDDATGERVELSAATYANWVAKTAGLLQDELDLTRGARVHLDLPAHWLTPVWLGAAWSLGALVTSGATAAPDTDLVVCGPAGVERHAGGAVPVVALSLRPMGARFAEPLPAGVLDYGLVVWGQPDAFFPDESPSADDAAWSQEGSPLSQEGLLRTAGESPWSALGTRLLTDLAPASAEGLTALVAPLAAGGGTVWVHRADPDGWDRRAETEHATVLHRR